MTIRVGRDRYCFAVTKMRIALDDVMVAKLLPREEVDLHGTGQPQTLRARVWR